jgi:thiol-disulfide isomerase/thioredoxin
MRYHLLFAATAATAMSTPTKTSELESLRNATEWINSPPLTAEDLRGKVVLVQFWTYSCVNWIRTMPYLRAWARKYRDKGLVVIGVHAPEFGFEHELPNVRWGTKEFDVDYPVAVDNDFAIWRAFGNQYWPALYFVDGHGKVRHRHFGEGEYEQSERVIQELLAEAGARDVSPGLVSVVADGAEAAADWSNLKSPETYLGSARSENRVASSARLKLNQWIMGGDWKVGRQAAVLNEADGRIAFRFHARDLNLVMAPGARQKPVRFRVLIDGRPPGAAHGIDVDEQGNGAVGESRMYQLIRQAGPIADRQFEIEFLDPGVEVFVFTFG